MTIVLTCPSVTCGEHNPVGTTHCGVCGKALLPSFAMEWRRCAYCGVRSRGKTCTAHRDLARLERAG